MSDDTNPTRRRVLEGVTGASTAAVLSLAGCTEIGGDGGGNGGDGGDGGNGGGNGDGGSASVEFWSSPNEQELEFHNEAAKAFTNDNDVDLEVRPVPEGDSSEEVVLSALASGTEPDVFANTFPGFAAQLEANDAAFDLSEIDGAMEFLKERCGETILSRYESPNGGLYQAPWKANPVLFQYNDTILEEAGYGGDDYPRTFDALLSEGPDIVENSSAEILWDREPAPTWYERWFDFLPVYLATTQGEGEMFTREGGETKAAFNNDDAATVLQFFQDLYANDLIPDQSGNEPKFPNDKSALNTGGPWVIPYFTGVNEDIKMSHLSPPVPDGVEPNNHTYADPKNTTIFQSAEAPDAAWSFIEFELQENWDVTFLEKTLQLPLRKGLVDAASSFFEENPNIEPYAQALETSHPPSYTPDYTKAMNAFGEEGFVPVTRGNRSPQEGLDAAEEAVNQALG